MTNIGVHFYYFFTELNFHYLQNMPNFFNNPWKNKNKNNNQRPPLYGNAYESSFNISLDSYNSDSLIYGSHDQPLYSTNGYNHPSYYQQFYYFPPSYSNENAWESDKHEYSHFENEQKKSNGGGWFNKSKVTPQSMSSDTSPKPPKKASTHVPFLEHRQGPQDAYQFSGTAYGNPPSAPKKTTQRSSSTSSSSKWSTQGYQPPNKWRYWFRFLSLLTSIGYLRFATGASPVSWLEKVYT
jgi:hypothetical protein